MKIIDDIETVKILGHPQFLETSEDSTKPFGLAAAIYAGLSKNLIEYRRELDGIRANEKLSETGRADWRAAALKARLEVVGNFDAPINNLRQQRDKARAKVKPLAQLLENSTAQTAIAVQALVHLPEDQFEVGLIFQKAIDDGDDLLAAAIEQIPAFSPMALSEQQKADGVSRRLGRDAPEHAALAEATEALEKGKSNLVDELEQITRRAGLPATPNNFRHDELHDAVDRQVAS